MCGYTPVHRIYQRWEESAGFNVWYYIKIEMTFRTTGTFSENEFFKSDSLKDKKDIDPPAGFFLKKGGKLTIKIGASFSSVEIAKKSVEYEVGDRNFDEIKKRANSKRKNPYH